jgi:hypothetical protein
VQAVANFKIKFFLCTNLAMIARRRKAVFSFQESVCARAYQTLSVVCAGGKWLI